MQDLNLITMSQDLNNWLPITEIPAIYPQFNHPTLKTMFWKRAEKPGLNRCCRIVGKRMFINTKLFGLWMAGGLPEQQAADE
ncbi:hypothetical protein [Aeromonas media]|uniref:hypothetical protein n=1 Tax=Aeromonas media TaxID=651 RepID=UPI001C56A726|nr:hypothetical protein [Aeromonas media]